MTLSLTATLSLKVKQQISCCFELLFKTSLFHTAAISPATFASRKAPFGQEFFAYTTTDPEEELPAKEHQAITDHPCWH